jgi:hypothetical protein
LLPEGVTSPRSGILPSITNFSIQSPPLAILRQFIGFAKNITDYLHISKPLMPLVIMRS